MSETIAMVTAPFYCSAVIIRDGVVVEAAPILRWAVGKPWPEVESYCQRKKYQIEILKELSDGEDL